jgi:lipopolysaccharide exporter
MLLSLLIDKGPAIQRARRNLTRLASGNVLSQIILALSTPLLTRLFAPDAFGAAALFSAAYAILIPIVTLKYDQAILQPKNLRSAEVIGSLAMIIATINSLIVGLIIIFCDIFREQQNFYLLLLPIALWLGAAYSLMQQWSSRVAEYKHFAASQVIGAIFNVSICIVASLLFSSHAIFIVFGFTVGIGVALVYTILGFKRWPFSTSTIRIQVIKRQFFAYKNFPLLVLPTALLITAGLNGIPFIISHFYSIADVGLFAVANRVLLIPAAIVGGSLAEVVRSEFAARQRAREKVSPIFVRIIVPILVLAATFFAIIYILPSAAFIFVFGRQYLDITIITQSLLLAAFSQFVCAPFVYVFSILRKPKRGLLAQIVTTIVPLSALIVMALRQNSLSAALFMYSLCSLVGGVIMLALVYKECRHYDQRS